MLLVKVSQELSRIKAKLAKHLMNTISDGIVNIVVIALGYQKLAFKKHRAADRQCKKDTLDPDFNVTPSLRERHVASATPISIPIFSLDTKVPAKTGYIGVRDAKASKKVYKLGELVGETSRFNFNLIEWDGKFVPFLCLIALASLRDTEYPVQL